MVDLGIKPGIGTVTEAPKNPLSDRDIYRSQTAVAKGVGDLTGGLEEIGKVFAKREGEEAARNAVVRQPDGSLKVETPQTSFIMGGMGDAYAGAVRAGMQVGIRSEMDQKLAEFARQFEGDPAGFQKAAGAYVDQRRADLGGVFGDMAWNYGQQSAGQHYSSLVDTKARRDFDASKTVLGSRIATLQGNEESLISQGVTSGPAIEAIRRERQQILDEMAANPKFNLTPELRKQIDDDYVKRMETMQVIRGARDEIRAGVPMEQVIVKLENVLAQRGYGEKDKQSFITMARANMVGVSALQKAELSRATADADILIGTMKGNDTVPDDKFNEVVARLVVNGGQKKAAELIAQKRLTEEILPMIMFGSPEEKAEARKRMAQLREGGVSVPGGARARTGYGMPASAQNLSPIEAGLLNAIAGPESAGLYNIRYTSRGGMTFNSYGDHPRLRERIASGANAGKTSDAAGRYQFLSSTWDRLPAEAKGDGSFTPENQDRAALYLAKQDYNKRTGRDLMTDLRANGMTPQILQALSGTWEGFQSEAGRRKAMQAYQAAQGGGNNALPVKESVIKEVQRTYDSFLPPIVKRITDAYSRGSMPSAQDQEDFREMYPYTSKSDQSGDLAKMFEAEKKFLIQNSGMIPEGAALGSFVQDLKNREAKGELNPVGVQTMKVAEDLQKEHEALKAKDPVELGARMARRGNMTDIYGERRTINWGNPDELIGQLSLRRHQVEWTKQATSGTSGDMPFSEQDRADFASAIPALRGEQVASIVNTMKQTFTKEQMIALMGDKTVRDAVKGMTRTLDPAKMKAGFEIMQDQLRENPAKFKETYGSDEEHRIARWQTVGKMMDPTQVAEYMQRADDPSMKKQKEIFDTHANAYLEKLTSDDVIKKLASDSQGVGYYIPFVGGYNAPFQGGHPLVKGSDKTGMLNEYKEAYRENYRISGVEAEAEAFALQAVKSRWSNSDIFRRVMRWAPDKYVPAIRGSKSWVKDQFEADTFKMLGEDRNTIAASQTGELPYNPTPKQKIAEAIHNGDYELRADDKTEKEIAQGMPPSYIIMYKNERGAPEPIFIKPGEMARWSPDHERAKAQVTPGMRADDEKERRFQQRIGDMRIAIDPPGGR